MLKLYSSDEIVKLVIEEKKKFRSHQDDLCYACHHKRTWIHIDEFEQLIPNIFKETIYAGEPLTEKDILELLK